MTLIGAGPRKSWGRMTMLACLHPSYEYLPHSGELRLRLHGTTLAEVLEQGGLALGNLLTQGRSPSGVERVQEIVLDAPDRAALLLDWLNELLYLAERDHWVPDRIEFPEATDRHLHATVHGPVLDEAPALVKAATWHGLRFDQQDGGYEAEVLLDV